MYPTSLDSRVLLLVALPCLIPRIILMAQWWFGKLMEIVHFICRKVCWNSYNYAAIYPNISNMCIFISPRSQKITHNGEFFLGTLHLPCLSLISKCWHIEIGSLKALSVNLRIWEWVICSHGSLRMIELRPSCNCYFEFFMKVPLGLSNSLFLTQFNMSHSGVENPL